jgi:tetratricopeptide (TPR) repeat protein
VAANGAQEVIKAVPVTCVKIRIAAALILPALCLACALTAAAGQDATRWYEDGKRSVRSGDYAVAIEAFTKALALLEPDTRNAVTVRLARAQAYLHKGDLQKVVEDINAVLHSPQADGQTTASALRLRGALYLRKQLYKQSLSCFTEAIKSTHDNDGLRSACFADRGVTFINMAEAGKAVSDLTKAIQLDPKSAYAYAARGLAYLREDKIDAARSDSEIALRMDPHGQTEKIARQVLKELSASASGPLSVAVPLDQNGHMFVQVRFSKKGTPHRFMLDTGATESAIDRSLLSLIGEETDVRPIGTAMVRIGDGSAHKVTRYKVKTAFLYHLPLGEIVVSVLDRPAGNMPNLLGVRSLNNVTVTIDNAKRTAEIRSTNVDRVPRSDRDD